MVLAATVLVFMILIWAYQSWLPLIFTEGPNQYLNPKCSLQKNNLWLVDSCTLSLMNPLKCSSLKLKKRFPFYNIIFKTKKKSSPNAKLSLISSLPPPYSNQNTTTLVLSHLHHHLAPEGELNLMGPGEE